MGQEIDSADAAVFAEIQVLPQAAAAPAEGEEDPVNKQRFKVVHVLKGGEHVEVGQIIEALHFGEVAPQASFFLTGVEIPALEWATPLSLTPRVEAYIRRLPELPPKGKLRLGTCGGGTVISDLIEGK